jgi:hypothetical protein
LGCCISPCYGPFSLGERFETYEPFISSIFQIFFGPQITETADTETVDTETVDTGTKLYAVCEVKASGA